MDHLYSNIEQHKHKRGKHLNFEDCCDIKHYHSLGMSLRQIAKLVNCSPSTVMYEIKRGTVTKLSGRGRKSTYIPKRGQSTYENNRKHCHRKYKSHSQNPFVRWVYECITNLKWSIDACVGYAKKHNLFPESQIVSTKSLYNAVWRNDICITPTMLPEALLRKKRGSRNIINKRVLGTSIEHRPEIASLRTEFGHWEIDTVVCKKTKKEAVMLTLVEKLTGYYLSVKIPGKDAESVLSAMNELREQYSEKFSEIFKTITSDNGSEFASLTELEIYGTSVYFAHPYSSYERPQNERFNKILRKYVPKGCSIKTYSSDEVLSFSDHINSTPRKVIGYYTSEELFETHLDNIYSVINKCVS